MSAVDELLEKVPLPRMVMVRQKFPRSEIGNAGTAARDALSHMEIFSTLPKG